MADTTDEPPVAPPSLEVMEDSRRALRRRWELASVLNFLRVFEPMIGKEVKMPAEEIETALIVPNDSLAKLHITLLKGIPPVNKHLSNPDAWITCLCKKFAEWWPWVADGEVPLTAGKGDEISRYKELDPAIRLLMLKALCELRTEQDDLITYINDALKEGTNISHFRKSKISESKSGISYWYDGDSVVGLRLYREVNKSQPKSKQRGKSCVNLPLTNLEWETLATNLDEFHNLSEELSSSSDVVEGAVYQTIETEVIPVLEKLQKKRERDLKRKQREEALLNGHHSYAAGPTRTCRIRKPVSYTFDEYDRSIDEAIKVTRERPSRKVAKNGTKLCEDRKSGSDSSDEDLQKNACSEKWSAGFMNEDMQMDDLKVEDSEDDEGVNSDKDVMMDTDGAATKFDNGNKTSNQRNHSIPQGQNDHLSAGSKMRYSSDSSSDDCPEEVRNLRAKNRLRQRPTLNSAVDSDFAADSDPGDSSENVSSGACSEEDPSEVPDSEDDLSS